MQLTIKVPVTTAADDSPEKFFVVFFSVKIHARQMIHMKHQALFSSKDNSIKSKSVVCCNIAWRFKG